MSQQVKHLNGKQYTKQSEKFEMIVLLYYIIARKSINIKSDSTIYLESALMVANIVTSYRHYFLIVTTGILSK